MYCRPVSPSSFLRSWPDKDAQVLGLMGRLRAPDRRQQGAMRHHLAGISGKMQQKIELLGRQVDWLALHGNAVRPNVNHKVAGLKAAVVRSGARRRCALTRASSS